MEIIPFGIDFGTSNIVISYTQNNKQLFVIDDSGSYLIPNIVNISNNDIKLGHEALLNNDGILIKNIKRLIGITKIDKSEEHLYPFIIQKDNNIYISTNNTLFTISEIIEKIFRKISIITQQYTGFPIKVAVITVPAYFSDCQRIIIRDSATNAGIMVLKIINEPTSAAIAGFNSYNKSISNCLVYDLGGGTLDITILDYSSELETYNVISTVGESHLGGEDFDNKLLSFCLKEFSIRTKINIDRLIESQKVINRVLIECKKCKEHLSINKEYTIYIESLLDGMNMNVTISRSKFENICYSEFSKCATLLDKLVYPPNINSNSIEHIILVGGASRMTKIRDILLSKIKNATIINNLNPDTLVAIGAAIMAYNLNKNTPLLLLDVTPLAIGIESGDGIMSDIISKNEHIPISRVKVFATEFDNQPSFNLNIYEGDYSYAKQNNLLGTITVNNLPLRKKGDLKIFIRFKIDNNGVLTTNIKYDNVKIKNTLVKIKDKFKITNYDDSFVEKSLLLLKFKDYLINIKYLFEAKNINYPKINKLLNWISTINTPENLKVDFSFLEKMKNHVENEINNLISTSLIYND